MNQRLRDFHAACLPFVTRALRGPRRRRTTMAAGLLALLAVLMGTWIALSPGDAARDLRVGLDLEENRWDREHQEFVVFVDSERQRESMLRRARHGDTRTAIQARAEQAWEVLDEAADSTISPAPTHLRPLQRRAAELRDARMDLAPPPEHRMQDHRYSHFDWFHDRNVRHLRAVIDAELTPAIVVYHSPLTMADAVRIVGLLAGGLLLVLCTICAPLWVGMRLAQELHDNTLQPLTGTALTARQLTLGLCVGSLAPLAIVAAPAVVLMLGAALIAGNPMAAAGFVLSTLAVGLILTALAMLVALSIGRRRAPGLIGTGLLALLGMLAMLGLGAGLNLRSSNMGLVTIVPNAGPVHLLAETFNPVTNLRWDHAIWLDLRIILMTVVATLLAAIALRAVERWIGGTHRDGALTRVEAMMAAGMLSILAAATLPSDTDFGEGFFVTLAIVLVPLQAVLMGRVPGGDVPQSLRVIPTMRLLGEHLLWLAPIPILSLVLFDAPRGLEEGFPVGFVHLVWALTVVALITIRGTALATNIPVKIWLAFCMAFAMLEFGTGAIWCLDSPDIDLVFPLMEASPVLGFLQIAMFLWIPISLFRALLPTTETPST